MAERIQKPKIRLKIDDMRHISYELPYGVPEVLLAGKIKLRTRSGRKEDPIETQHVGSKGTINFWEINNLPSMRPISKAKSLIAKLNGKKGINILGIRSHEPGLAKSLLEKMEYIAKLKKSAYLYFITKNIKMHKIGQQLGYKMIGTTYADGGKLHAVYIKQI